VSFSPAFKWFIALLLPLTLVWKLTLRAEDSSSLENAITGFLIHQDFAVSKLEQGFPVIRATRKTCRMFIMQASPDGWNQDIINNFATEADHIFIVFRGKIYNSKVGWKILSSYLISEVLYRLRLVGHQDTAIAVIAPSVCEADRLPWDNVRDY
jgi:hypothetical protein